MPTIPTAEPHDLSERLTGEQLQAQMDHFSAGSFTLSLLEAVPSCLAILNRQRQIVYANSAFLDLTGAAGADLRPGMRPGELLSCIQAPDAPDGCGTAEACATCGAGLSIMASLEGRREQRECALSRRVRGRIEAIDLHVRAEPIEHRGEGYTVFAFADISHEKRRHALEKIFFHDVLNIAGSVKGFAEILRDYDPEDRREVVGLLHGAAEQVIEEIKGQRILAAAECGKLAVDPTPLNSRGLLQKVLQVSGGLEGAADVTLRLEDTSEEINFVSDQALLARVLGNLVKNAIEASGGGETVTVGCRRGGLGVEFRVHNEACIPRREQLQVFRRTFSTKGRDRGLGTYSIRLLSECMQGEVSFSSSEEQGTTFRVSYPLAPA